MQQISVSEYIAGLPASVRAICKVLRSISKETMPGANEMVYHNALGYSLSESPFDRICYIAPQAKGYVNFGFFFGGALPDPSHLLTGEGKRLRHVKIYNVEEARNPALEKLIGIAWRNAEKDINDWRKSLRRKKTGLS